VFNIHQIMIYTMTAITGPFSYIFCSMVGSGADAYAANVLCTVVMSGQYAFLNPELQCPMRAGIAFQLARVYKKENRRWDRRSVTIFISFVSISSNR